MICACVEQHQPQIILNTLNLIPTAKVFIHDSIEPG